MATRLGFCASDIGRVALIATETATNIVKHAGKGQILLRDERDKSDVPMVQVLALDRGPGMSDVARCMRDGYSTAGSSGTGLGAVSRLASLMDIYSTHLGTAILAQVLPQGTAASRPPSPCLVGSVRVPYPGESVCGDGWCAKVVNDKARVMVADGLGHGPHAAAAAYEAVRLFEASRASWSTDDVADRLTNRNASSPIRDLLQELHRGLLSTRGAAVSIAEVDVSAHVVHFAGVGNVTGMLVGPTASKSMVTHGGTVGAQLGTIRVSSYPWSGGALVLHTDDLTSRTSTDAYPGLLKRHPTVIAGVLYRDFARGRDDATVVVVTERRQSE
jgi:anti-sigma regulatory factor (Ser/Thr protein kinase)